MTTLNNVSIDLRSKKKKKRSLSSSFFGDDDDEQEQDLSPTFHRRDVVPSHFLLKIDSFHSLSKSSAVAYYSSEFESGGYKWYLLLYIKLITIWVLNINIIYGHGRQLSIFPNGDTENGGEGHMSVSLELLNSKSLPTGWEVHALFTFFLYDQIRDQYVTSQGNAKLMRFHSMRTEWGIPKYIELETFNDGSNGYLVNESCTFGAEVFVVKNTFKGECLSMIVDPIETIHTWKFDAISTKNQEWYESDPFVGGAYKWYIFLCVYILNLIMNRRILVYPKGSGEGEGTHISLFLQLEMSSLPPDTKLFVRFVLRLKNQTNNRNNFEEEARKCFSSSSNEWGLRQFMSLAKFEHLENGFILNDTCIIEAECKVLGLIKN
ncbi:hypothetical protein G4B88_024983 [Cannabis sativa]|uniref:MATH domain-containing protein n=1 Tax=Cannabis sativa TaxID=3483 RepID=A0A7J6EBJ1_CANSA|nr:hypothetical protein G4B88_024983 [Cannabis sativa]